MICVSLVGGSIVFVIDNNRHKGVGRPTSDQPQLPEFPNGFRMHRESQTFCIAIYYFRTC